MIIVVSVRIYPSALVPVDLHVTWFPTLEEENQSLLCSCWQSPIHGELFHNFVIPYSQLGGSRVTCFLQENIL